MDSSDSSLICNVVIENLNSSQETLKRQASRKGEISLWRNEHKEVVLGFRGTSGKQSFQKYVVKDLKFHCKYLKEGKVSITIINHSVRFLLSNCPPENLKNFCKILSVKLSNEKGKGPMSLRQKMLLGLPKALEEISPLNEKDIAKVNERNASKENAVKGDAVKPENRKRKLPLGDATNRAQKGTNGEAAAKRRMISLPVEKLNQEQKRVLIAVKNKLNIFFTGSAGTGKSFLLKYIVGMLPPAHTFVTASTGVAACQIGGMTLHSFAGLGRASGSVQHCIEAAMKRPSVLKQWKKCQHLIIDEISMIDGDFFDKLEAIARCTEATSAILQKTSNNKLGGSGILATKLCTHREDVDYTNTSHLEELSAASCTYHCEDNSSSYSAVLDQALPDTRKLTLKLGAQVMLTKNLDVSAGLVNGARGVITGFTNSLNPSMRIPKFQLLGESLSQPQNLGLPIVRFLSGIERTITHEKWSLKISQDCVAARKQIPLKLAWAISIHKSQGMSLDCVEMCLSRVFECGQAYVALSRATSLRGLKVDDFSSSCVRSNVDAIRFYRNLRRDQMTDGYNELIPLGR